MRLPLPRGPISEAVLPALAGRAAPEAAAAVVQPLAAGACAPLGDVDLHLALAACYELHYQGFEDADDRLEWSPPVLALRAVLEHAFEGALREACPHEVTAGAPRVDRALRSLVAADDGPP